MEPIFRSNSINAEPVQTSESPISIQSSVTSQETNLPITVSIQTVLFYIYLTGVFISFLMLVYSICSVLLLFRRARQSEHKGYRLMIVDNELAAFSFGRTILISQHDYDTNAESIITHEQSHIRLGHFYDLMLIETIKIIFWFNPLVYSLMNDLKEIHEFQADDCTLNQGIDATQYQLLIIKKCVGHQKFALANSFNHCQIKNRITMMNKQKTSKAGLWKVATFLPLLALLLMAFGKTGENVPMDSHSKMAILNEEKTSVIEATTQPQEKVYSNAEIMPEFPGGEKALRHFISDSTHYPKAAEAKGIQGKVFVSFIVNSDGKVIEPKVTKGVDPALDAEALRLIRSMPNWMPGKIKGTTVRVSFTIPINFVLETGSSTKSKIVTPSPNPNKDRRYVWLDNNGTLKYDLVYITFDVLAEKVKSDLQNNPKLQFDIMVEEGKVDERVSES